MPTAAAQQALDNLRNPELFQWYVIPLLAIIAFLYFNEIEKKNWNVVFAGLTYLGLDLIAEIANSLVMHFSNHAPIWGTPGKTACLLLVGMNIEILFMFSLVSLSFSKLLPADKTRRIAGVPGRVFVAFCASAVCVSVELMLNAIGALTWEYAWWRAGAPTLFLFGGYLSFFLISFWVYDMPEISRKAAFAGILFGINIVCAVVFAGVLKWI